MMGEDKGAMGYRVHPAHGTVRIRIAVAAIVVSAGLACASAEGATPAASDSLVRLSLEELARVEVTSVSRAAQPLGLAAAAIHVISREEILRSGARSVPEALRLAPNLQVTQLTASNYVITARGFGGSPAAQHFSNKLLILIDGRSVYTPLYSGIYWDAQDVVLGDVDRIEVISGPGATLWGANAMNGVINIVTRSASTTQGTVVRAAAGNQEVTAGVRHGGLASDALAYRVYAKAFDRQSLDLANGDSADDGWWKAQAGFRLDWAAGRDTLTTQGDFYRGTQDQLQALDVGIKGANVLARWRRTMGRSQLQVQAYVDVTERAAPIGGVAFELRTYDVELQHEFALGDNHTIVWGGGARMHDYEIRNSAALLFEPPTQQLDLGNVFIHDTLRLGDALQLSLGVKLEKEPYEDWTLLPDIRLAWTLAESTMAWAAASQSIRSATPFDAEVVERIGPVDFLRATRDFESEKLNAYEVGVRTQPASVFSMSASVFYNDYDDLRTIETAPGAFLPLRWGNEMRGHTYGLEAWAHWQVLPWWRLSPGIRTLHKNLEFKDGASRILGLAQAGNDPRRQATLRSSMELGPDVSLDAQLRYIGELPDPATDSYYELDARVSWRLSATLELSLAGFGLLHPRHQEFASPYGEEIPRSVVAEVRWTP